MWRKACPGETAITPNAAKSLVRLFYTDLFQNLAAAEECIGRDYNNEQAGHRPDVLRAHPSFHRGEGPRLISRFAASAAAMQ